MRKHMLVRFVLVVLAVVGAAGGATLARVPYELFTLSNGVRVIVHTRAGTPLVALHAFVKTGAALEDDFLGRGISHYVEHIVFGTTTRRSEQQVKEDARALGDTHNAYTSEDQTCFHMTTLTNQWPLMADVIADQLHCYVFSSNEVRREQQVIIQEIKMGDEEPDSILWELLTQTAYYVSPLRVPVAGHCAAFATLTPADVQRYYRERYVANNLTVVVAGPLTRAEVEPVLEASFGAIPAGREWPRAIPPEPPVLAPRTAVRSANVQEVKGCIAFPTVSGLHPDAPALDVLARVLGQGELAPLVKHVQKEQRWVTDIATFSWTPALGQGLFIIEYACAPGNETAAVAAIVAECMAARDAVAPADVARIQRGFAREYARTLQAVDGVAGFLGGGDVAAGDPDFSWRGSQRFMDVGVADVVAVARAYLQTNVQISVMVRPRAPVAQPAMQPRTIVAAASNAVVHLPNGIRIVLRPSRAAQLAAASVYLPGGLLAETPTNNGISTLLARMLTKGTATRTADEIARVIEARGASLRYQARRDGICGELECAPADLPAMLDILADTLWRARFPTNELENERRIQLAEIRTARDDWQDEAMLAFNAAFFAGTPYALPLSGASNVVAALTSADLAAFHQVLLQPSHMVIAIAGAVDAAAVAQCRALFGALPASITPPPHHSITPSLGTTAYIAAPREQATVMLGVPAPCAGTAQYPTMLLLNSYLGGMSGALFDSLRGNADLVYIVYADVLSDTHVGGMLALAQCMPDNAALVHRKMSSAIADVCHLPLATQIVADAKTALAISMADRQQSPAAQAFQAAVWEYRGLGADYADTLVQAVQHVTPDDVLRCAQQSFTGRTTVIITPHAPVARARDFLTRFPEATAQDVYKMLYQAVCGPGHLIYEGSALQDMLTNEWASLTPANEALWLPIGIGADWAWFNLRAWKAQGGALEPVARAMWQSVHAAQADPAGVAAAWQQVVAAAADGALPLAAADVAAYDAFVRSNNYPVVHHTDAFVTAYQPAYRVLSRHLFRAPRAGRK
jgi:zinc protease